MLHEMFLSNLPAAEQQLLALCQVVAGFDEVKIYCSTVDLLNKVQSQHSIIKIASDLNLKLNIVLGEAEQFSISDRIFYEFIAEISRLNKEVVETEQIKVIPLGGNTIRFWCPTTQVAHSLSRLYHTLAGAEFGLEIVVGGTPSAPSRAWDKKPSGSFVKAGALDRWLATISANKIVGKFLFGSEVTVTVCDLETADLLWRSRNLVNGKQINIYVEGDDICFASTKFCKG